MRIFHKALAIAEKVDLLVLTSQRSLVDGICSLPNLLDQTGQVETLRFLRDASCILQRQGRNYNALCLFLLPDLGAVLVEEQCANIHTNQWPWNFILIPCMVMECENILGRRPMKWTTCMLSSVLKGQDFKRGPFLVLWRVKWKVKRNTFNFAIFC